MVNKAILVGNVGQEPETTTIGENTVVNFTLATSERRKDAQGNKTDAVEWHRVSAWNELAKIVQSYVHKGTQLYVEGKITYKQNADKQGVTKTYTTILASNIKLLGHKQDGNSQPVQSASPAPSVPYPEPTNDLPF